MRDAALCDLLHSFVHGVTDPLPERKSVVLDRLPISDIDDGLKLSHGDALFGPHGPSLLQVLESALHRPGLLEQERRGIEKHVESHAVHFPGMEKRSLAS